MTLEERDEAIEALKRRKLDKQAEIRPYRRKVNKRKKWCIVDEIKEKKRAYAREWYRKRKIKELEKIRQNEKLQNL